MSRRNWGVTLVEDAIGAKLALERRYRKGLAARIRQAINIGTNLGYSAVIAAAFDLINSSQPKIAPDTLMIGAGFMSLTLTLIFAPSAER